MRYLPHSDHERADMLGVIGASDIDALFSAVPKSALKSFKLDLPDHSPEFMVEAHMRALAGKNQSGGDGPFFVGAGAYRHHVPATVDHLIQRSEWLTAYTPYQLEISQGTLQMLFEFQTQVAKITGMDVANASLYDGSTEKFMDTEVTFEDGRKGRIRATVRIMDAREHQPLPAMEAAA